ncbi:hypothetical protein ACJX0J_009554, partial [Zea mays]
QVYADSIYIDGRSETLLETIKNYNINSLDTILVIEKIGKKEAYYLTCLAFYTIYLDLKHYLHNRMLIQGDAALKKHITFYYRGLFGPPKTSDVTKSLYAYFIIKGVVVFQHNGVLGQGDPLSPIVFNIVMDMLAVLGQLEGLSPHLVI